MSKQGSSPTVKTDYKPGDRVKMKTDVWDDGQDHHPPGYLAHSGEVVNVRSNTPGAHFPLALYHDGRTDNNSFLAGYDEVELVMPRVPSGEDYTGKLSCVFCGQSEGDKISAAGFTGKVVMSSLLPICDGCANLPDASTAGHPDFVEGMRDGWLGRHMRYVTGKLAYACGYERGVASRIRLKRKQQTN